MKKNNAKTILYVLIIAVMLMSATAVTFALFSNKTDIPTQGGSGELKVVFDETTLTGSDIFTNKGDTYTKTFKVKNAGGVPFMYSLVLELEKGGLEDATLLYLDGKYLGSLGRLFSAEDTWTVPSEHYLYLNESFEHEIKLEYHIGAGGYYALNLMDFTLNVNVRAVQLFADIQKTLFVSDYYQFKQIIDNYDYSGYTVRLCGDITLEDDVEITAPLDINLAGYRLKLGNYGLVYDYQTTGNSRLYSIKSGGVVERDLGQDGTVTVNTPQAVVVNELKTPYFEITAAGRQVFSDMYDAYLEETLSGGIRADTDIFGAYKDYTDFFAVAVSVSDEEVFDGTAFITPDFSKTVSLSFLFDGGFSLNYDVRAWGSDADSIAETIIESEFFFLSENYTEGTLINGDVFLPTQDRKTNSRITWISENREILDESGRFNRPYVTVSFELSAIISVNGVNILKTFPVTAISKTAKEKLREICMNIISFAYYQQEQPLFRPSDFPHMTDLESLSYGLPDIPQADELFEVDNENYTLELKDNMDIESTYLYVTGVFDGETVVDKMNVKINVLSNISYWNAAFSQVLNFVALVEQNTLEGFSLPAAYRTIAEITYSVPEGQVGPYVNPQGVGEYVKIKEDNKGLEIIAEKLPTENTMVTVDVSIGVMVDGVMEIQHRYFRFSVGGVIHYAEDDIADINLYQELRRLFDTNDDWILTRDEIDASDVTAFTSAPHHNIASLKGIEFFTNLKTLDASYNSIIDISPLNALTDLENLNLSHNQIVDIGALKNLNNLVSLDLSYNGISDISALKNKNDLTYLYIQENPFIADLSPIAYMPYLLNLNFSGTQASTVDWDKNTNMVITAYQNAQKLGRTFTFVGAPGTFTWSNQGNNWRTANTIINNINPIYEFANVIFLPPVITYNNISYPVEWRCSHPEIVRFDGNRAYIVQPLSDINVRLLATIVYNTNYTITKSFDVLSRGNEETTARVYDYRINDFVDADIAIPDETLRFYLFKTFDTTVEGGIKNRISQAEISAFDGNLNLSGLGIKNLEGLALFKDAIKKLDLRLNSYGNLNKITGLTELTELKIDGENGDLSALLAFEKLSVLNVYGVSGVNNAITLSNLYDVYINNPGISIYKDSLDYTWNPYLEPMTKALKNIEGIYVLYPGGEIDIKEEHKKLRVIMYNNDDIECNVAYSKNTGIFSYSDYTISSALQAMPARDEYGLLAASITIGFTTVTRQLSVISLSDDSIKIEIAEGQYEYLVNAVPNDSARKAFLARILSTTPLSEEDPDTGETMVYYPKSSYMGITSLTFSGQSNFGVKGLELLSGSTALTSLTLNGYMTDFSNSIPGYVGLNILNSQDYSKLKTLTVNNSILDLFELFELDGLTRLDINNSTKVIIEKTVGIQRVSVFSHLNNLTRLQMTTCNIRDFWAIQPLKVTTLLIYGNPASTTSLTDYYVEEAYDNLSYGTSVTYRVINSNSLWESKRLGIDDLGVTYAAGGAVKPYPYDITYFTLSNGQNLDFRLPLKFRSSIANVEWTAVKGSASYSVVSSGPDYMTVRFTRPSNVTVYTVLKGTVKDPETDNPVGSVEYVFVSIRDRGTSAYYSSGGTQFFNIHYAMMENGRFADYQFAYYVLGLINEYQNTGTFAKAVVEGLTQINRHAANNSSETVIFNNIKGIRYFISLKTVNLNYHTIEDIGELYYLESLENLRMENNRIQSLETIIDGTPVSVFYKMNNLKVLEIANNPGINDFAPIVSRQNPSTLSGLSTIRVYQASTTYFPAIIDENDPDKLLYMAKTWWSYRKTVTSDATLYLVQNQNLTTYARIEEFFNVVTALENVVPETDKVSVNSSLGRKVTIEVEPGVFKEYDILWGNYGSNNGIVVTESGIVESINTEIAYTNHRLKMRVYIILEGTTYQITRLMYINIFILENYNDEDLLVEISAAERNTAYAAYPATDLGNGYYTVKATDVIPDPNLRNRIFAARDTQPRNGIISTSERNSSSSISVDSRAIDDIRGIELFERIATWTFNNSQMEAIPQLYIKSGSLLRTLNLRYFYNLKDVENLLFDGDGDGPVYTSLYSILTALDLRYCTNLPDSQYRFISGMPSLLTLNLRGNRYSDVDVFYDLHPVIRTLTLTSNNANYANRNFYKYMRLVLDSKNGLTLGGYSYLTAILKDLVKLDIYEADNAPHNLPTAFTVKGYDRVYGIRWTAIEGHNYSVNGNQITISPDAEQTIPIMAQAFYTESGVTYYTWSEQLDIITLKNPDLSNLHYRTEGFIWHKGLGMLVNIEDYMPDPALRYYVFKYMDKDLDGVIDEDEIENYADFNGDGQVDIAEFRTLYDTNANGTITTAELTHVPDTSGNGNIEFSEMLAYYDTNGNSILEPSEVKDLSFNESLVYINSLKGIDFFEDVKILTIGRYFSYDLSPLESLEGLSVLFMNSTQLVLRDTSVFERMGSLKEINFSGGGAENYNFVGSQSIEYLKSINNTTYSRAQYALYTRNAWAYARMYNRLNDRGDLMGGSDFINTQDEKYAACILNAIDIETLAGSYGEILNENNLIELPSFVEYQGHQSEITWIALSKNLEIDEDNALTVKKAAAFENYYTLVARITYNGSSYERLFEVRYAE